MRHTILLSFAVLALFLAALDVLTVNAAVNARVVAWGDNTQMQTNVPVAAQSGVVAIAAGSAHTVALKNDGMVLAWGYNGYNQANVPLAAQSGVKAIAAGAHHTVALTTNGVVLAWGDNTQGQTNVPITAQSGVAAIAAGQQHTVALKNDGSVVAWGYGAYGQTTVPVEAQSGVIAIAAGGAHAVALKNNGTVLAWGYNSYGQVSETITTTAVAIPVTLQGQVVSGVTAVAAGLHHTVALKSNAMVVAWGANYFGQATVPAEAQSGVKAITAGSAHNLALKNDGTVVAWGNNSNGQTNVPASLGEVIAIAAGGHSVALVLIPTPPTITTPPASQTVIVGRDASFTVTATGTAPLSYQWYGNGTAIPNATNTTLTLTNLQPSAAGNYFVVVSNSVLAVTSAPPAVLTITLAPVIYAQPQPQSAIENTAASFSVASYGQSPFTYQWRKDGANLPGATGATLSLSAVRPADAGAYSVVVSNPSGADTSTGATLTVLPPVPVVTSAAATATRGLPFSYQITAINRPNSFNAAGLPAGLSLNTANGLISGTPTTAGVFTVTLSATNGTGSGTATLTLTVLRPEAGTGTKDFLWAKPASGTSGAYISVNAMATDSAGNIYAAGFYGGSTLLDSDTNFRLTGIGQVDFFLLKLDSEGRYLWVRQAGGTGADAPHAMCVDAAGNVYLAGTFGKAVPGDRTTATFGSTSFESAGSLDVFVTKVDPDGNFVWARKLGGIHWDSASGIAVDKDGNVIVVGYFRGTGLFGSVTLNSAGFNDAFIAKLGAVAGNVMWATNTGGTYDLHGSSVVLDVDGNIYLSGNMAGSGVSGTVTFGPDTIVHPQGSVTNFIAKYGPNGNALWGKAFGGGAKLGTDSAGRSIYLAGSFGLNGGETFSIGNITLTNGPGSDVYVARMDTNGVFAWAVQMGGTGQRGLNGMTVDGSDNLYLSGYFGTGTGSIANFGTNVLTCRGTYDCFVATLSSSGAIQRVKQGGGTGGVQPTSALTTDSAGALYVGGSFDGTATFGSDTITSYVQYDGFLAKLDTGLPSAAIITAGPQGHRLSAGANVTFSVTATGSPTPAYQWFLNGVALAGATGNLLTVTNVQQEGSYTVTVTNIIGTITSSPALLRFQVAQTVRPPLRLADGHFQLFFNDIGGGVAADLARFEVHYATNLFGVNTLWVTNTGGLTFSNGMILFDDPSSTNVMRRFYRVIER